MMFRRKKYDSKSMKKSRKRDRMVSLVLASVLTFSTFTSHIAFASSEVDLYEEMDDTFAEFVSDLEFTDEVSFSKNETSVEMQTEPIVEVEPGFGDADVVNENMTEAGEAAEYDLYFEIPEMQQSGDYQTTEIVSDVRGEQIYASVTIDPEETSETEQTVWMTELREKNGLKNTASVRAFYLTFQTPEGYEVTFGEREKVHVILHSDQGLMQRKTSEETKWQLWKVETDGTFVEVTDQAQILNNGSGDVVQLLADIRGNETWLLTEVGVMPLREELDPDQEEAGEDQESDAEIQEVEVGQTEDETEQETEAEQTEVESEQESKAEQETEREPESDQETEEFQAEDEEVRDEKEELSVSFYIDKVSAEEANTVFTSFTDPEGNEIQAAVTVNAEQHFTDELQNVLETENSDADLIEDSDDREEPAEEETPTVVSTQTFDLSFRTEEGEIYRFEDGYEPNIILNIAEDQILPVSETETEWHLLQNDEYGEYEDISAVSEIKTVRTGAITSISAKATTDTTFMLTETGVMAGAQANRAEVSGKLYEGYTYGGSNNTHYYIREQSGTGNAISNPSSGIVAYCYNFNKNRPNVYPNGNYANQHTHYVEISDTLAFINSLDNPSAAYIQPGVHFDPNGRVYEQAEILKNTLLRVLYNGYENNGSGIKEKYGLTNSDFRAVTQGAIYYFTNAEEVRFTDRPNLRNACLELISGGIVPSGEMDLHIYTYYKTSTHHGTQDASVQNLITGEFSTKKGKPVKFAKYALDKYGRTDILSGAQLSILTAEEESVVVQWTSTASAKEIYLEAGDYILREDRAPRNYYKVPDIYFSVDDRGNLLLYGAKGRDTGADVSDIVQISSDQHEMFVYDKNYSTVPFAVKKIWDPELTPRPIEIRLLLNGEPVDLPNIQSTVMLSHENNWVYEWYNLPDDGVYTAMEIVDDSDEFIPQYLGMKNLMEIDSYTVWRQWDGTGTKPFADGDRILIVDSEESKTIRAGHEGDALVVSGNGLGWQSGLNFIENGRNISIPTRASYGEAENISDEMIWIVRIPDSSNPENFYLTHEATGMKLYVSGNTVSARATTGTLFTAKEKSGWLGQLSDVQTLKTVGMSNNSFILYNGYSNIWFNFYRAEEQKSTELPGTAPGQPETAYVIQNIPKTPPTPPTPPSTYELPKTGGMGTGLLYAMGAGLVMMAALGLKMKKRFFSILFHN